MADIIEKVSWWLQISYLHLDLKFSDTILFNKKVQKFKST